MHRLASAQGLNNEVYLCLAGLLRLMDYVYTCVASE